MDNGISMRMATQNSYYAFKRNAQKSPIAIICQ